MASAAKSKLRRVDRVEPEKSAALSKVEKRKKGEESVESV